MWAEIKDIKKRYGRKWVLKGVNVKLEKGTCIGILGENGCGKSTLFSVLAGVIRCNEGEFIWKGQDLLKNKKASQKALGYVPQGTALFPELTAKDNLRMWYEKKEMERELSEGVLAMLGIQEYLKVPVRKLSGGMKKRLAIGCAVASHPEILLLDEPSAALDLVCKERIYNYLTEFKKRGGIILLATHEVQELSLCDRWFILKNGILHPYEYDGNIHRLVGRL